MKRSKMIAEMADILDDGMTVRTYRLAERILIMQEQSGMLPPAYKDPDLDGHRFAEATYRNEWEPEHESLPVDPKYLKQKIQDSNGRE